MVRRRLVLAALLSSAATVAIAVLTSGPLFGLEMRAYDLLLRPAGAPHTGSRVAVITVDDESIAAIGQWPWSRDIVARLVDRLHALGAAVVALDVLFGEPDRAGPDAEGSHTTTDLVLAESLRRGKTILGYAFVFGPEARAAACAPPALPAPLVSAPGQRGPEERLFRATGAVCSLPVLSASAAGAGFLNIGLDADGTLRRLPLVMARDGHLYPSLALAAVRAALGDPPVTLAAPEDGSLRLTIGSRPITLDDRGTVGLRFRDGRAAFAHIPAVDVLNGRVAPGALDDRIVFVGATALGIRDNVNTPVRTQHPGIEVHATAAENLLADSYVVTPSSRRAIEALAAVAAAVLVALVIGHAGFRAGAATGILTTGAAWFASAWGLQTLGAYVSPVLLTAAVLVSYGAVALTDMEFERRRADEEGRRRRQAHEFVVKSLTSLMEMRDVSTGRHSRRTQGYSRLLAQRLAYLPEFRDYLTPERIELISLLAPLHDIGKVGIRDAVLNKPSPLTADEFQEMRLHPVYGYETISKTQRQVGIDTGQDAAVLQLAKDIVYTHHERWDGTGYPRGLQGTEIPVPGRIMALVDVYDALVEPRPYRRRLRHDEAVELIVSGRGTQFDPKVVEAFLTVSTDFLELGTRLREAPPTLAG